MQRWAFFSLGVTTALVIVLALLLIGQQAEKIAYANAPVPQDIAGGSGTIVVAGGTQQQLFDMVWILYRRRGKQPGDGAESEIKVTGDQRLTLAAYRIQPGGRGQMKLLAVRDISYDVEAVEYMNEAPSVLQFKKELEKMEEDRKKREKEK